MTSRKKMKKHETGVSSLRRIFETRITQEPIFDKQMLETKKTEVREKKYITELENLLDETTAVSTDLIDNCTQKGKLGDQIPAHEEENANKQITSQTTNEIFMEDKFEESKDKEQTLENIDTKENITAQKPNKPPLPPKPTKHTQVLNASAKSTSYEVTEKPNKPPLPPKPTKHTQVLNASAKSTSYEVTEKPNKPPLPPKPTKHTQVLNASAKSTSYEVTEKPNKPPLPPKPTKHTQVLNASAKSTSYEVTEKLRLSRYDNRSSASDSVISSETNVSVDSAENMRYMAEVYRPWMKYQIRVNDLLPLLNLGKEYIDIIKSKHRSSPSDAVELLLDIITESDTPGIWQNFLDALETKELLKSETEIHHTHSTDILKLVTHDLEQRICIPEVLSLVYGRRLLVASEYEEANAVYKTCGSQAAAKVVIECVDKHLPNWDVIFADILEQSDMADIAELFRFVEQPQIQGEIPKKDKSKRQKLHERRIKDWERKTEQMKINEAGFETQSQTPAVNKIVDFNALCIAVPQIQSDLKTLTRGMEEIHQRLQNM